MDELKEMALNYYRRLRDNDYCVIILSPSLFKSLTMTTVSEYSQYHLEYECKSHILYRMKGNNSHLVNNRMYALYRKGICIVMFEDTNLTGRSYRKLENKPKKLPPLNYC